MISLSRALEQARRALLHHDQAGLEAEVLLAHVLGKPRSHLHAWPEAELEAAQQALFERLVRRRAAGEPVAYLTGRREFWSLDLEVNAATLIPRPETELLVEQALALLSAQAAARVADLGTGSGAVAIALSRERPQWQVFASDRRADALEVARRNARRLAGRNLHLLIGDWAGALAGTSLDAIVSNPPYVSDADPHLQRGDTRYEPRAALAAGPAGLDELMRLVDDAARVLKAGGWLCVEHAPTQTAALHNRLKRRHFSQVATLCDLAGLERVTRAHKPR
ncbi:MAG: peptide chain release factor N(5)-glutamine methyltransferase [Gammaproteobacteria bacterium]